MNQIPTPITHPIAVGVKVRANKPSCPCKGATYQMIDGVVLKAIHNQSGHWYYLDVGVTVKGDWIVTVL